MQSIRKHKHKTDDLREANTERMQSCHTTYKKKTKRLCMRSCHSFF